MNIKIVSDISLGSAEHGNEGATFTFKIHDGEKKLTYSGVFKHLSRHTNELECRAAYIGIMTALSTIDIEPNTVITAYIDNENAIRELWKGNSAWAADLLGKLRQLPKDWRNIVCYYDLRGAERHSIHEKHSRCHNASLVRFRQKFTPYLSMLGKTARTHQEQHSAGIPKNSHLWKIKNP